MFNNKKKEINRPYRDTSNRALGFGLVTYVLLLILIATSILFQSCEVESINTPLDDLQKEQQEEIEREINEVTENDDEANQSDTIQDPSNPLFSLMDTSLINSTVDFEQDFDDLTTSVYTLEVEGDMNFSFIKILGKKGIRIETGEGSRSCFIEINQNEANVISGEYDKYSIKINGNYLYLFNDKGSYIFIS